MKSSIVFTVFILLFFGATAFGQTPKITRGPYLQVVTTTSVIVRWSTDQPTKGRVWFGASTSQLTRDVKESEALLEHTLTLTGLQPATKYAYAIGYDDTQLVSGADYYVKTAVPAGDTRPLRFWVLGDFGSGTANQKGVYDAYRSATATRPADLWVWLGDNAYGSGQEQEFQEHVFDVYPPTLRNTPIFITPGNHDYAFSESNFNIAYFRLFSFPEQGESGGVPSGSKSYFSADYGNVHLISLDSQGRPEGDFRLYDTTSTQVQWLKRDLAANKLPWTIVIFHHPPYSKGGHDSDFEASMVLIRENLTPILERYGVDLVLNGHSHGYERTYRLKGMRGLANTFDKTKNIAENTTARYDDTPNSCPILTKGEGTVYVVNGSGGQLGGQSPGFPHPGTVYNNISLGGSMILDVSDNRLDAQLVMSDKSVLDKFTILKNVNKTTTLTAQYGDTVPLIASWPGDYRWPDGQTSRNINYVVNRTGTFPLTVRDNLNCLADVFRVTVPQPTLTAKVSASACVGSSFTVTATLDNITKADGLQYDIFLSDASGNFTKQQTVGSGKINELKVTLPTNLPAGSGYRVRVQPRGVDYVDVISSDAITIKSLPTATLAGSTTILQGQAAQLTLDLTGEGPWKGTLSDGTAFSGLTDPTVVIVRPTQSTDYSISSLENGCGKGTGSGKASVIVQPAPKITAKTSSASVCVGSSLTVTATLESAPLAADLQYDVLLSDGSGSFTREQIVGSGKINELKATIPTSLSAGSGYRLEVRPRGTYAQLVPSAGIVVKALPTATLAGSATITQGESLSLSITFTGDGPWKGTLSDGTAFSGTASPTILSLKPSKSIVYSIATVENGCGKGTGSGQESVTVLLPTAEEEFAGGRLNVYPNPTHDLVYVDLTTTQKNEVIIQLSDMHGRSIHQQHYAPLTSLTEPIHMPHTAGTYLLTVQVGQQKLTRKVVRQ